MSGILGFIDPDGPDPAAMKRAARVAEYRGHPEIEVRGSVGLGTLRWEGDEDGMVRREGSLLVADARVDALLDGYEGRPAVGAEALDFVLGAEGPAGLWSVAADFAAARYDRATASVTLVRDAFGLRPL